MQRGLTGRYEETAVGGERVRAFIPAPLPPEPVLEMGPERQSVLERALLACGRLDAISTLLPDPDIFLYSYVRREAVLSSQIEGTQSSLSDLLVFELDEAPGAPFDDVVEVSTYVAALEHGLSRLAGGFPLSNRLIREMHGVLLSPGRGAGKQPGEFRLSQNWLGGTRPGDARFVPPPPHEVEDCMAHLERFIHDPKVPGALVKTALAHVQFETIHPFLDGNGRVGRLLIAMILHNEGVIRQPLLYLSLYFKQHRQEYYGHLNAVRTGGDWESWLDFFLEGVAETASGAMDTAHQLLAMFDEDARRVQDLGRAGVAALRVFDALRRRPVSDIEHLAGETGMAYSTASRAVGALEGLGILRELTGRRRSRVFAYDRYLALLSEAGEPL